jgi:hypothetical protein
MAFRLRSDAPGRPNKQRGWLRNPFPSPRRIIDRMVGRALEAFAQRPAAPRRVTFEALEPRLLLSASPLPDPEAMGSTEVIEAFDAAATAPVIALGGGIAGGAPFASAAIGQPTDAELDALLAEAKSRMSFDGDVRVELMDLDGPYLARAAADVIRIDLDATGYGWFVDATPQDDHEFAFDAARGEWLATSEGRASGRIDLLSVMMHEIGHLRGEDHAAADADPANVMHETFGVGMRRFHFGGEGGAAEHDDDTQVDVLTTLFGEPLTLTPTIVWIGGASGNWNLAANWRDANSLSRLPTASDDVFIGYDDPNTPGNDVATITVSTNVSARALLSEENVLLSSGGRLNLSADSEISAALTGSGGILAIADTLTLTGQSQWNSGDWNVSGGLVILGELTIASGADHWLNGTLSNRGLVIHEAGRIWLNQGTIQNLAAEPDQQLPGGIWEGRGGVIDNWSNGNFRNFGELRGAGTYSVSVALTNAGGTISGQAGTLSLNASTALQDGTVYAVAEGAVVQHNAGSHVLSGGISGSGAGRVLFNGGSVSTAAGAPATLDFAEGLAEWQSGNWSLGGSLVNVGHLRVTSGADRFLTGTQSFPIAE